MYYPFISNRFSNLTQRGLLRQWCEGYLFPLSKRQVCVAVIPAVLRHCNPNTTARYLRTLGLDETRKALENALNGPGKVIPFEKFSQAG